MQADAHDVDLDDHEDHVLGFNVSCKKLERQIFTQLPKENNILLEWEGSTP